MTTKLIIKGQIVSWQTVRRAFWGKACSLGKGLEARREPGRNRIPRTLLVAQWLRLRAPAAGDTGSIPDRGSSACPKVAPQKKKKTKK